MENQAATSKIKATNRMKIQSYYPFFLNNSRMSEKKKECMYFEEVLFLIFDCSYWKYY